MPAFLVSIPGPHLSISGAILLNGVVSERLTETISLVPVSQFNEDGQSHSSVWHVGACRIAHILRCLQCSIDELEKYYREISPTESKFCPSPHFSAFTTEAGQTFSLKYLSSLHPSMSSRSVFHAEACSKDGSCVKECVVKFTARYCKEAHLLVGDIAPELMYCKWEPSVGQFCIITAFIDESQCRSPSVEGLLKLENAVTKLHAASYVHGDLRGDNILIDSTGQPRIIDFDWSGKEGKVVYPADINSELEWAEGVSGATLIKAEHDREMLSKYKKSFTS